jgi:hypothetical protein
LVLRAKWVLVWERPAALWGCDSSHSGSPGDFAEPCTRGRSARENPAEGAVQLPRVSSLVPVRGLS